MGTRRAVIIVVAVAIAAVAAFANYAYLNTVQDRAYDNAERVKVFVVKKDIEKGVPGDAALSEEAIRSSQIPKEFRPNTSIVDINEIKGKVAIAKLTPGQVIVDGMFVDPAVAQVTAAQRIPAGRVTVTVSVDAVSGVGGNLLPNDKVNLLVVDSSGGAPQERVLYQNVEILFIGTQAAPQPGETAAATPPATSGVITFSVPPEAASRIVFASQQSGGIYLSLVPPDNAPVPVHGSSDPLRLSGGE
jgi:pilus assembly protein CpaB